MTKHQRQRLAEYTGKGTEVQFKRKGSDGHRLVGVVEDVVAVMKDDYHFVFQRIRLDDADDQRTLRTKYAYRLGYYTYHGSMRRIGWGQYSTHMTEPTCRQLMKKARAKGWPIFSAA